MGLNERGCNSANYIKELGKKLVPSNENRNSSTWPLASNQTNNLKFCWRGHFPAHSFAVAAGRGRRAAHLPAQQRNMRRRRVGGMRPKSVRLFGRKQLRLFVGICCAAGWGGSADALGASRHASWTCWRTFIVHTKHGEEKNTWEADKWAALTRKHHVNWSHWKYVN